MMFGKIDYVPRDIKTKIKMWEWMILVAFVMLLCAWVVALFLIGPEKEQGEVYRIMFVHVPVAWCAFMWLFMSALFSVGVLVSNKKIDAFDLSSQASMECAVVFSLLVLVTGSIWGRPTWGVWWDWDPRLTSSLVMFLVACAYLVLRQSAAQSLSQKKMSAIVSILCALNVPIVYYSVNIWRSLHQPQTFVQNKSSASSDVTLTLLINFCAMTFFSICIYKIRRQNLSIKTQLEHARMMVNKEL